MRGAVDAPAVGQAVMVGPRGRHPRVVHQLARTKEGFVLYPCVMVCGYAATAVYEVEQGAPSCQRCWT